MNRLRSLLRNKLFRSVFLFLAIAPARQAWATGIQGSGFKLGFSSGGIDNMTKDLVASSGGGTGVQGSGFTLDFSIGEPIAGYQLSYGTSAVASGYLGGRLGAGSTLQILSTQVGAAPFYFQNGIQVGTTLQASVQINFSDQLDPTTFAPGISAMVLLDHLGQVTQTLAPITFQYNPVGTELVITPQISWQGDTVYDIVLNQNLLSINGYSLASSSNVPFITALDPQQENVVINPISIQSLLTNGSPAPGTSGSGPSLNLDIPLGAISQYAMVLFNSDPLNNPLLVDPQLIRTADQKAQASGGEYATPVGLSEIVAYDLQGSPITNMSMPAQATISFNSSNGFLSGTPAPVHTSTLSMWALDKTHSLWVKMPASSLNPGAGTVSAPITQFSVYALMGGADGSASDTYVFPDPWRPHGPNAGEGSGQTGTESGGMTFSNLPSECTIKIYTLSQELVRELHHSDIGGSTGQEKWDGLTSGGSHAASGVYLWRVDSNVDGKNGKLMVIR